MISDVQSLMQTIAGDSALAKVVANLFHAQWYHSPDTWSRNKFLGYAIQQCPFDLQIYQELVYQIRPAFILQTGVSGGGSIVYFASLLDLIGADPSALVVGIDIKITDEARTISHPRVRLVEGSSTDPEIVREVRGLLTARRGFVSLDSDHSEGHVSSEMEIYKDFVEVGSYMVVEDTNINGNPVFPDFGPGPLGAVCDFLGRNAEFASDEVWCRNKFSFHQGGWLKRFH